MANCVFKLVVFKCRSWFASVSKPLVRVKCVADRWFVVCRCVVSFRVSCAHRMESDVYQTHSHRPAAQCYLPHGPFSSVNDLTHLTRTVEPLVLLLAPTLPLMLLPLPIAPAAAQWVPTVPRTLAHSCSARGVATLVHLSIFTKVSRSCSR